MIIRQLEYFVAVARERHFGRAAAACYVSQPALSTALAKLERELNLTLINRGQNFEGLTQEGERLAIWAKRLLADRDGLKAEAEALRSGMTGSLRIGTDPTVSMPVVELVAAFCASHPRVKAKVYTRLTSAELLRQLRNSELDAVISHFGRDDRSGLRLAPLYKERLMLLVPDQKFVPGSRTVTWAQAAELPLALLTPDMRLRQITDKTFADCGVWANPQLESDSVANLVAHVCTGEWASVIPDTWLPFLPATANARAIRLVEPERSAQISVATQSAAPTPLVAATLLRAAASRQSGEEFARVGHDLVGVRTDPL